MKIEYKVYLEDGEEISKHDTYEEALKDAKCNIDCGVNEAYVVECVPVAKVRRGKTIVTNL